MRNYCWGCLINIVEYEHKFDFIYERKFDFILLEMTGFEVITGMDWLSQFRGKVDFHKKRVIFKKLDGEVMKSKEKKES